MTVPNPYQFQTHHPTIDTTVDEEPGVQGEEGFVRASQRSQRHGGFPGATPGTRPVQLNRFSLLCLEVDARAHQSRPLEWYTFRSLNQHHPCPFWPTRAQEFPLREASLRRRPTRRLVLWLGDPRLVQDISESCSEEVRENSAGIREGIRRLDAENGHGRLWPNRLWPTDFGQPFWPTDFGQTEFDLLCVVCCVCVVCVCVLCGVGACFTVSRSGFHVCVLVSKFWFGHVRCPRTALPRTASRTALPLAAGASHDSPRTPKRAHLSAPALPTPPKFHEKTPREGKKERILWREREKKARNFGPPTLRAPTLRGPTFSGFGPLACTPPLYATFHKPPCSSHAVKLVSTSSICTSPPEPSLTTHLHCLLLAISDISLRHQDPPCSRPLPRCVASVPSHQRVLLILPLPTRLVRDSHGLPLSNASRSIAFISLGGLLCKPHAGRI